MSGLRTVRWVLAGLAAGAAVTMAAQDRVGWYPVEKGATVPGFTRGLEGKPFQAKATWTTRGRDPKYGDYYTRSVSVELMRDGMGRERMEWPVPVGDPRVSANEKLMTVVVLDPMARCVFLWIEEEGGKAADAVKVRCEPEGVVVPARPAWNALNDWEQGDLTKEPESKPYFKDVPIGKEEIGGVVAEGFQHEEVRSFDGGKRVEREHLGQKWYSDALGMVVRTSEGENTGYFEKDVENFSISEVKLGEPPAERFALPAGVKVEVDRKLSLRGRTQGRFDYLNGSVDRIEGSVVWPNLGLMEMTDQAARLDHAEFPESWYANGPKTAMPAFYQDSVGKPFDAIGELMVYPPNAKTSTDATQTIFLNVSRDSAGRSRFTFRLLNGGPGQMVYVLDPVAGCIFQWSEIPSWETQRAKPLAQEAKVRCNARGVVLSSPPRWDDPNDDEKAQIAKAGADKLHFVNERVGEEKVGDRDGRRVAAVRYARYAVYAGENGSVAKKVKVAELWYSPELDTVVQIKIVPKSDSAHGGAKAVDSKVKDEEPEELTLVTFQSVEVGEPVEDFYPPYGYEIKVDETLLPPFAPAPVKAATNK